MTSSKYNPQNWPQWLKVGIGLGLLAGNAWLPYLSANQSLSPQTHMIITTIAGSWLYIVNTWNRASGESVPVPVEK